MTPKGDKMAKKLTDPGKDLPPQAAANARKNAQGWKRGANKSQRDADRQDRVDTARSKMPGGAK
jgi:hypothetical protein